MNLLDKVVALENEASEFGFQWENTDQILEQIESECREISEHLIPGEISRSPALQEEIGDLLHAVFSLCVFCQLSPEKTLQQTLEKFEKRLQAVKSIAHEKGLVNLQGFAFDELMEIWREAKIRE